VQEPTSLVVFSELKESFDSPGAVMSVLEKLALQVGSTPPVFAGSFTSIVFVILFPLQEILAVKLPAEIYLQEKDFS
jgi:hypothetical protein